MASKLIEIKKGVYATEKAAGVLGKVATSKRASSKIIRKLSGATVPVEEQPQEVKQPSEYTEKEKEEYVQKNLLTSESTLNPQTQFELGTGRLKIYRKTDEGLKEEKEIKTYKGAIVTGRVAQIISRETPVQKEISSGRLKTYRRQPSGELVETTKELAVTEAGTLATPQVVKATTPFKIPGKVISSASALMPTMETKIATSKTLEAVEVPAYTIVKEKKTPEIMEEDVLGKKSGFGVRDETTAQAIGRKIRGYGEKVSGGAKWLGKQATTGTKQIASFVSSQVEPEYITKKPIKGQPIETMKASEWNKSFIESWASFPSGLGIAGLKAVEITGAIPQVTYPEGRKAVFTELKRAAKATPEAMLSTFSPKTGAGAFGLLMLTAGVGSQIKAKTAIRFGETQIPQYKTQTVTAPLPGKLPTFGMKAETISTVKSYQATPMGGEMTISTPTTPIFYQGLYLERPVGQLRGYVPRAEPIFGYTSEGWKFGMPVFKQKVSMSSIGGMENVYTPQTALDAMIVQQSVRLTAPEMVRMDVNLQLSGGFKGVVPKQISEQMPRKFEYATPKEAEAIYGELRKLNTEIYGSASAYPQVPAGSIKYPSDIDVMLTKRLYVMNYKQGDIPGIAENIAKAVRRAGDTSPKNIRVSGTLVEKNIGGTWHHIVDIHTRDMGIPGTESAYGIEFSTLGKPAKIEGFKAMSLSETYGRKAVGSSLSIGEGGIMPAAHRLKDIPSAYIYAKEGLIPAMKPAEQTFFSSLLEKSRGTYESATFDKLLKAEMAQPSPTLITASRVSISSRVVSSAPSLSLVSFFGKAQASTGISSRSISASLVSPISPSYSSVSASASKSLSKASYPSMSISPSISPSIMKSMSISRSISQSRSISASISKSMSASVSISPSVSVSPSVSPSISSYPSPSPSIYKTFIPPPPGWLWPEGEPKARKAVSLFKSRKRKTKYQPTITAYAFSIYGKPIKGKLTGFEQRPIPKSWAKALKGFA